jgi:hypothetical protein
MYLFLQAHYAGPFLLQQTFIFSAGGIVEGVWHIGFLSKGCGGVGRIDDAEVCDYGFVPGLAISGGCLACTHCTLHSQLLRLSVGKDCAHDGDGRATTIHQG